MLFRSGNFNFISFMYVQSFLQRRCLFLFFFFFSFPFFCLHIFLFVHAQNMGRGRKFVLSISEQHTRSQAEKGTMSSSRSLRVFEERLHQSLGPVEAWTGIFQQSQSSLFFSAIRSTSISSKQNKVVGSLKVEAPSSSSKGSPALQVPQALLHADLHHLGEHLLGFPTTVLPIDLRGDVADDVLQCVRLQLRPRVR